MNTLGKLFLSFLFSFFSLSSFAQDATVKARVDATQITVGDQIKLHIEAAHNSKQSRLQWAALPDTFNSLEIVEKGKIDTSKQGDIVSYKQQLLITGFDSGSFKIPAFPFPVIPHSGTPYSLQTDSFQILVQTIAVDTTKPFKGIKEIIAVKSTWQDYLWFIIGGIILLVLAIVVFMYFRKNKKTEIPVAVPKAPPEPVDEKALRLLGELERQQLWQKDKIKEYYVQLTDILRMYIEERFQTPAMELTTDELLQKVKMHPEMGLQYDRLSIILRTADLAKFAKAQPLPHEHTNVIDLTKQFVMQTKPVITNTTQSQS
ncbi:MAG TPA: hypothetical protein PL009_02205 [Flavipsychrobacter sp.]|nr:hypothetical protein [Flavipsychrobacter sp.]